MNFASKQTATQSSPPSCLPWPREIVDKASWLALAESLAKGERELLSLWGETSCVHMAVLEPREPRLRIVTFECPEDSFPSVGRLHPPALRLERAIHDLYGLKPEGTPDHRAWLDHGRWGVRQPCGARHEINTVCDPYTFLTTEGEPLHLIPVGPVHAGIIEPGHFRFSANGETVVRLEERLGFVHKGVDRLMGGASIERAAQIAARVSGDSTVAYSLAFAQAVEAAFDVAVPPRATYLRALMAELERLANHFGDIGAICNDAAFALMHAQRGLVRERILREAASCFGHRLMMDRIAPGGTVVNLRQDNAAALYALVDWIELMTPRLIALFGDTTSLQDRTVGTGVISEALVKQYACGGYIGRASGRAFDARKAIGYAPYPQFAFEIGASKEGDVDARVWVRFDEIKASLKIVRQILDEAPGGPVIGAWALPEDWTREGAALVEGFRGDVFVWLRIRADGVVQRCHLRDPSWFQWPLLEAAIKDNIVADFPLCNKSFNCSYSGHDL
ncbi:NADH-quinone oxidoreductase subunit C [Methylocystis sp.]|uniref:NADH-quinone oxidoreductase subunit D-related protein n=1 Tax=Methylocystis sp. TaxID=1911079 RepID=UPI0025D62D1C|nr:NADH-quinone oxidoreductase subunit C [Methylocystis sp.]